MPDDPIPDDIFNVMQGLGRTLGEIINEKADHPMCFVLMVFDIGEGGRTSYISNGRREDIIEALKEFIARQDDADNNG